MPKISVSYPHGGWGGAPPCDAPPPVGRSHFPPGWALMTRRVARRGVSTPAMSPRGAAAGLSVNRTVGGRVVVPSFLALCEVGAPRRPRRPRLNPWARSILRALPTQGPRRPSFFRCLFASPAVACLGSGIAAVAGCLVPGLLARGVSVVCWGVAWLRSLLGRRGLVVGAVALFLVCCWLGWRPWLGSARCLSV